MLKVLRAVVEVVGGRVGGLLNVVLLLEGRDEAVGFDAEDVEVGRFVLVVRVTVRLVVEVGSFLAGEVATFCLTASGLVTGSSPEGAAESTGVAGTALSDSASARGVASAASAGGATSAGGAASGEGIGSSVEAMMDQSNKRGISQTW